MKNSLFHSAGFVSHSVKYVSHTVVFVFHSVKQRICLCNSKNMNRQTDIPLLIRKKNKNLSFFDKIFLFFFCSSKIILTFAYRKTINIYRIQTQTNTIIYTQTRTIMKKTFTKKTLVAGIAAALMTLTATNVNAKETFIYGQNQQSLIVSTLNEDGKTLNPKWKYEYQYDTLGTMTEKKAYRWDAEQMTWTPAYLLTWKTEGPTLQKLSENK